MKFNARLIFDERPADQPFDFFRPVSEGMKFVDAVASTDSPETDALAVIVLDGKVVTPDELEAMRCISITVEGISADKKVMDMPLLWTSMTDLLIEAGYQHVTEPIRRRPGRPVGSTKPDNERLNGHLIRMTDAEWIYCLDQPGNASEFIRSLVAAHRAGA